jgi:hypothetical protein
MTSKWFILDWNFCSGVIVTTLKLSMHKVANKIHTTICIKLSNMIRYGHCSQKCIYKMTIIYWNVHLLEWKLLSNENVINLNMSMFQILMSIIKQTIKWFQSHTHVIHVFYVHNVLAYFTTLKSLCCMKSYFYFYLNFFSYCCLWMYVHVHVWICVSMLVHLNLCLCVSISRRCTCQFFCVCICLSWVYMCTYLYDYECPCLCLYGISAWSLYILYILTCFV